MGATVLTDAFPATSDLRRSTLTGAPRIAPGCIAGRSTLGVLALSCVLGPLLPRGRIGAESLRRPVTYTRLFTWLRSSRCRTRDDSSVTKIPFDFSTLPGDVALWLTQQQETRQIAAELARVLGLGEPERQFIHDEIVGAIAKVVDDYLEGATRPRS